MNIVSENIVSEMPIMALNPLSIPRHALDKAGISRYRVYRMDGESELIEASSAAEAVTKAGGDSILKVTRETRHVMQVVPNEQIEQKEVSEYVETSVADNEDSQSALQGFLTIDMPEADTEGRAAQFSAMSLGKLHAKEENAAESTENVSDASATAQASAAPEDVAAAADVTASEAIVTTDEVASTTEAAVETTTELATSDAASAAPVEETELSEDEVNKLLNGDE